MTVPPSSPAHTMVRVVCDDAGLRAMVEAWLQESQLPWPGPFELNVRLVDQLPTYGDEREVFEQPTVAIQAGPPDGTVRIVWSVAPAMALVHPTEAKADVLVTPGVLEHFELAERSFLLVTLVFVLRRLGWYHVHGAALNDPDGTGWLLAASSNAGKSTTTALMASQGWQVATDDIGFMAAGDDAVEVLGFRSEVALRPGGVEFLGRDGGLPLTRRNKHGFWPVELGSAWIPRVTPRRLIFPRIGERTAGRPLPGGQAVSELLKWSMWILFEPLHAQEHLDLLARLVAQCRCYEVTLGPDLFDDPNLLPTIVHDDVSPLSPSS